MGGSWVFGFGVRVLVICDGLVGGGGDWAVGVGYKSGICVIGCGFVMF